jgi:AraC-like DNA-binding protein
MQDYQKQFIRALLAYGAQREVDPEQVCKHSGLDYKSLNRDTKAAITAQQVEQLWKNLSHLSNDSLLGLHFGESMQLAALGVVGQIIQTSNTVGEALTNAGALIGLITDLFSLQLEHDRKSFIIRLIADQKKKENFPFTYRHMADYLMVFIVHELDGLLLQRIQPWSVQFPYPVSEQYEYARVFRCPVQQKKAGFSIELSNTYLSQSIISANYELQNQLLQRVNLLLKDAKEEGSLQTRIFNYLLTNSYLYAMSLEAVASNFNVSPRTLQRKLKEEGVSFLQIVDEVRQKLAIQYLASGNYLIKDVAYILGYNEQSAFIRAFKRWTGKTPVAYLDQIKRTTTTTKLRNR